MNFNIHFQYPWLLLLLIPAFALTLIPYFRTNKRYRRNRNRITSMVLHLLIMVLGITTLAGILFTYEIANDANEILLVVDMSFSGQEPDAAARRDSFVRSALALSESEFKMGVVTFGYDQVLAAPFSYDASKVYEYYLNADLPDVTATDIASALNYARTLFTNSDSGKIVLITDGIETDGNAASAVKNIAAEGIQIDTVYISATHAPEVQIIGVSLPTENILVGNDFEIGITVQSSFQGRATITVSEGDTVFDDPRTEDKEDGVLSVDLKKGVQTFTISNYYFSIPGMHELSFAINCDGDNLKENNSYQSYLYLEVFDQILIVERFENESDALYHLLTDEDKRLRDYDVNVVNIRDTDNLPMTTDELRVYDEVILVNIAGEDMPAGFENALNVYVEKIGGGLFTVGGSEAEPDSEGNPVAHAYNRLDMEQHPVYQRMLPVQAIDFTPPVGVVIIIDRSGSMSSTTGSSESATKLDLAKAGAMACLGALTSRDYCAIMTLDDSYDINLKMVPMTDQSSLRSAIENIELGGGTVFTGALQAAGQALNAIDVERRHIILVTDGIPSDHLWDNPETQTGGYGSVIRHFNQTSDITLSIVAIGSGYKKDDMETAAETLGGGHFYNVWDTDTLPEIMKGDVEMPEIKAVNRDPFTPTIVAATSQVVAGVTQDEMPQLGGFFGTRRKSKAEQILAGPYVPVYAQWLYGKGRVGSFTCDLKGTQDSWSYDFLNSSAGTLIVNNIVQALFPQESIRKEEISVTLSEQNYSNYMSIFTDREEGETIEVIITGPADESGNREVQRLIPNEDEGQSNLTFVVRDPGVYTIVVQKVDEEGNVLARYQTYKSFSYSLEYDVFLADEELDSAYVEELAKHGDGKFIAEDDAGSIFAGLIARLVREVDPRLVIMILVIVLFLLDIAVRKFKFKWLHEIIRDRREKKAQK